MKSWLAARNVFSEAVLAIAARPGRSIITAVGTLVGVGALTASIGIATTTGAQADRQFQSLANTLVTVTAPADSSGQLALPLESEERLDSLHGVKAAELQFQVSIGKAGVTALPPDADESRSTNVGVIAASPGIFDVSGAQFASGAGFSHLDNDRHLRVAVLGSVAATTLGLGQQSADSTVNIDGVPFLVMGVLSNVTNQSGLLNDAIIPVSVALEIWGPPVSGASVTIATQSNATSAVAHEAPLMLNPQLPKSLLVIGGSGTLNIQAQVGQDFSGLIRLIGGIALVIGFLGIGAITLLSVIERTSEIGLRRALGARRSIIGCQFVCESAILGFSGGVAGTIIAICVVLAIAQAHQQLAVFPIGVLFIAPLVGMLVGMLAGAYPSLRAARLEPVEALRR